jgi:hypothetical protein
MPDIRAAHREATRALADAVRDFMFDVSDARVTIEIRDETGPALKVSATIATEPRKPNSRMKVRELIRILQRLPNRSL